MPKVKLGHKIAKKTNDRVLYSNNFSFSKFTASDFLNLKNREKGIREEKSQKDKGIYIKQVNSRQSKSIHYTYESIDSKVLRPDFQHYYQTTNDGIQIFQQTDSERVLPQHTSTIERKKSIEASITHNKLQSEEMIPSSIVHKSPARNTHSTSSQHKKHRLYVCGAMLGLLCLSIIGYWTIPPLFFRSTPSRDASTVEPSVLPVRSEAKQLFLAGNEKMKRGYFADAIADYDKAIQIRTDYVDAFNNRGSARDYLGDKQGAIEDYTKAIQINPKYAIAYNNRGNARLSIGDKQGAIEDFDKAIQINPKYADAYSNRSGARDFLGDKQGAVEDLNKAIQLTPYNAYIYYNRGVLHSSMGNHRGAITDYNKAIQLNSKFTNAYINRGNIRSAMGDQSKAIADYDKAIRINPEHAGAYINRGNIHSAMGDHSGAIADYDKAIQINPEHAEAYINRGNIRSAIEDKEGALSDYNKAIQINSGHTGAYINRGNIRFSMGDKQGAFSDYDKAIQLNPQNAYSYFNRGQAKLELGLIKEALQDYENSANLYRKQDNALGYLSIQKKIEKISSQGLLKK